MLKGCKDTISMMRQKEAELENDVKLKYSQMIEREDKLKNHLSETRDERDRLR